jgi:uncharacterized membrane protein (DUF441 family)
MVTKRKTTLKIAAAIVVVVKYVAKAPTAAEIPNIHKTGVAIGLIVTHNRKL